MEKGKDNPQHTQNVKSYIDLSEPLSFWIVILAVSLIIAILLTDTPGLAKASSQYAFLTVIYQFVLFGPGIYILPLIAGTAVGIDVGRKARTFGNALRVGLLNAIYGSIIYTIAIVVMYEVITYALPKAGVTSTSLIYGWIALPVIVFILVAELLAIISHSRKM